MKRSIMTLLLLSSLLTMGCAKEKSKSSPAAATPASDVPVVDIPDGPYVPPGNGPGQGPGQSWQYGATAELNITSLNVFSNYTGRPMNNPQDIEVNINLLKYGKGYGGHVTIRYTENGQVRQGYFTSGASEAEVKYNIWFRKGGNDYWHGFFEDFMGGLIVVIDGIIDLGDGLGPESKVSGSVWYKNFGLTYAPHPPTRCWFVSLGPYDCRAWKTDRAVNTTRAIYPDAGYQKLGNFTGLDIEKAFNGTVDLN